MNTIQQAPGSDLLTTRFDVTRNPDLELIEGELFNVLSDSKGAIREMCSHILNAGGKRIRPILVLYSGLMFSNPTRDLINAAIAAELIHMASLVHDDIIDKSYLRRNRPSVNNIWGNTYAVLCGDYLFAKAFGILSDHKLSGCMSYMVEAIQNMCHGEIFQAGDRFDCRTNLDKYYDRISMKTAIFLACCCKSGAHAAGADELYVKIMGEYGLNLGLAFQIIDDILDFCGDSKVMGKAKREDLRQGNVTIPVIFLMGDEKYGSRVKEIISGGEITEKDIDEVVQMLNESGSIVKSYNEAKAYIDKARNSLGLLPESKYRTILSEMTDMLQTRAN